MGHIWIIDVLADLKSFAEKNELPLLAEQLDDVATTATAEILTLTHSAPHQVQGGQTGTGRFPPQTGTS